MSANSTSNEVAAQAANAVMPFLNTQPGPNHNWKVSLENKIIAITGANRGIGLGIAEVCLANEAPIIYSLDLFEPGEELTAIQNANPEGLHYLNCDVTSEESIENAINTIVANHDATKGAVRNMTHTLGMQWAHGIRVNSISPGFVKTAMTYFVDQAPDWNLKMQYYGGMPRLADPKELGGAYAYLLSDAASYTTGIDIPVAGNVGAS
ncbi:hypothetical protein EDB80DRAFT_702648 [Ilyonectria destructans]|nr:hypothetical protein EDB80DRAFT_702648 [Ilyonectria destructans]